MIALLKPREVRVRTSAVELAGPARVALRAIPGARNTVGIANGMCAVDTPIQLNILGPDLDVLERLVGELGAKLHEIDRLISSSLLTLMAVPVQLTNTEGLSRRLARLFPAPPDHGHGREPSE